MSKKQLQELWSRINNPVTIVAIVGHVLVLTGTLGLAIDNEAVITAVESICSVGVLLGVLNNSSTKGLS